MRRGAEVVDRYAVVGNPVAHSRSPEIHRMFAQQTGARLRYERMLTTAEEFDTCVTTFFAEGGNGLNITLPFKEQAYALATDLDAAARRAAAVNVMQPGDEGLWGGNTDGIGLVRDLTQNHGVAPLGLRVLMLGAGGAARGVLGALLDAGVAQIVIVNRTHDRAQKLVQSSPDPRLSAVRVSDCDGRFDLVINATSASLRGEIPEIDARLLEGTRLCYDMVYAHLDTSFVSWAKAQGAPAVDGLGMLVEQAAESFFIWRGVRPETASVLNAVRRTLA